MLGIGIHKANQHSSSNCPSVTAQPTYLTLQSTLITYADVQNNYTNAVTILTLQIQNGLSSGGGSYHLSQDDVNSPAVISILGISPHNIGVMVVVGLAYTSQNAPPQGMIEKQLDQTPNLSLFNLADQSNPMENSQPFCDVVSTYKEITSMPYSPTSTMSTASTAAHTVSTSQSTPPTTSPTTPTSASSIPNATSSTSPTSPPTSSSTMKPPTSSGTANTNPTNSSTPTIPHPTNTSSSTNPSPTTSPSSSSPSPVITSTSPVGSSSPSAASPTTYPSQSPTSPSASTPSVGVSSSSPIPSSTTPSMTTSPSSSPCYTMPPTSTTSPTSPPTPSMRDIILLIDDSTALNTSFHYNSIRQWLITSLIPLWPIGPNDTEVAPVQYAQQEYNVMMSFDENTRSELLIVVGMSQWSGKNQPSITRGLRASVNLMGRQHIPRVVLLITASSNLSDIEQAQQYSQQLSAQGSSIITLAIGDADGNAVGLLSSGPAHSFNSTSFIPSNDLAKQITKIIYGNIQPIATTPTPGTTLPLPIDLPCHPDISILLDTSSAVGSIDEYHNQVNFISNSLVPSWPVSPATVEVEGVISSTTDGSSLVVGSFQYADASAFALALSIYRDFYYATATPSISTGMNYLSTTLFNRRSGRSPVTLIFTYSSDFNDIQSSLPPLSIIGGNVIIVGMGQNISVTNLHYLTGNVISGMQYNNDLVTKIGSVLCSSSPPITIPPSTPSTSSPPPASNQPTTTPSTTSSTTTPSTPLPIICPDCYPNQENILISLDAGNVLSAQQYSIQQSLISSDLTTYWNHYERVALLGFDDDQHFQTPADFSDLQSHTEFSILVQNMNQMKNPPNLTSAFKHALNNFHPLSQYGQMKTVIFTSTASPFDISASAPFATRLRAQGQVIIVGMNMSDVTSLMSLASNGSTIPWPNLSNSAGISNQINTLLGTSNSPATTNSPPLSTSPSSTPPAANTGSTNQVITATSNIPTAGTTTVQHSTTTIAPSTCSKNIIILMDESNAVADQTSFNQVKTWISNVLLPLWQIGRNQTAVSVFGYADKVWDDVGADFDSNSLSELQTLIQNNLYFNPTKTPSISRALRLASSLSTPSGLLTTILISASDNSSDVTSSLPYSYSLQMNGNDIITVSIGSTTNNLDKLSSGPSFSFHNNGYQLTSQLAQQITTAICIPAPTIKPTTTPSTTVPSTTVPMIFPCNPDIAFVFDSSSALTEHQFIQMVNYTAYNLISSWSVNPQSTEVAILLGNEIFGYAEPNEWQYGSIVDVRNALIDASTQYLGGPSSIESGFANLQSHIANRRQTAPLVTILFTYSSNPADVRASIPLSRQSGDVIIIGLGTSVDASLLQSISSYLFIANYVSALDSSKINSVICSGSVPTGTLPPITSIPTTQQQTTIQQTTTMAPFVPDNADVTILIDASGGLSSDDYALQKDLIGTMVLSWTYFNRIGLASYAGNNSFNQWINYGSITSDNAFNKKLNIIPQQKDEVASIQAALSHTLSSFNPTMTQRIVLFTSTRSVSDITSSIPAAQVLQGLGSLIVVGIRMGDNSGIDKIASPGMALAWSDLTQTTAIQNAIMYALSPSLQTTTTPKITTTSTPPTTPGTGISCPDCYPNQANILLILDATVTPTVDQFANQRAAVSSLVSTWSHLERISLYYSSSSLISVLAYQDLSSNEQQGLQKAIMGITQTNAQPNITKELKQATLISPISTFGPQRVVLFTATNAAPSAAALQWSSILQSRGSMTVVGIGMDDTSNIMNLASPGYAIAWTNTQDITSVVQSIMKTLPNSGNPVTGGPTTQPPLITTQPVAYTTQQMNIQSTTTQSLIQTTQNAIQTTSAASQAATTSTVPVITKNVLLLIDESNAIPDQQSFDKVKSWIRNTLLPLWPIDSHQIAVAPYGYADKVWDDIGGDFSAGLAELQLLIDQQMIYYSSRNPNIARAIRAAAAVSIPNGLLSTVLISASDNTNDISSAMNSIGSLQTNGNDVITVSIGNTTKGNLAKLSSGAAYSFHQDGFDLSADLAVSVTAAINLPPPTSSQSTKVQTTSLAMNPTTQTSPNTVFPCNPDISLVFDSSSALTEDQYIKMVNYTAYNLISSWTVNPQSTEVAILLGNEIFGYAEPNEWQYGSIVEVRNALIDASTQYLGGPSSIESGFANLQSHISNRRQTAPLVTILFTYSSNPADVRASIPLSRQSGDVIIIGLGTSVDASLLQSISSYLFIANDVSGLDSSKINNVVCSGAVPTGTLPPMPSTSTVSNVVTTIGSQSTRTVQPIISSTTNSLPPVNSCPDCYPDLSNLMIIIDASTSPTDVQFTSEKAVASALGASWNHLERVGLSYSFSSLNTVLNYKDLQSNDAVALQKTITNLKQTTSQINMDDVLKKATFIVPVPEFGPQRIILFTANNVAPSASSIQSASILQSRGSMTVIGIGMDDITNITSLASDGKAIAWNTQSIQTITNDIMATLPTNGRPSMTTVQSSTSINSPVITTSVAPSNNYIPPLADILIVIDNSIEAIPAQLAAQKTLLINLLSGFNHFERIAMGSYGNRMTPVFTYGDVNSIDEATLFINSIDTNGHENITKSMSQLRNVFPLQLNTRNVVFLTTATLSSDVESAVPSAASIEVEGTLIVIGIEVFDVERIQPIASPNAAISWSNTADTTTIIKQIMSLLGSPQT